MSLLKHDASKICDRLHPNEYIRFRKVAWAVIFDSIPSHEIACWNILLYKTHAYFEWYINTQYCGAV